MRRTSRSRAGLLLAALVIAALLPAAGAGAAATPALQAGPRGRVAPELLALAAERRDDVAAGAVAPFRSENPTLLLDERGERVAVQVTALDVDTLLPALAARGFTLLGSAPALHFAEGFVPIGALPGLADLSGQGLLGVVSVGAPQRAAGAVTSQGDAAHEAERVRASAPGYDGSGLCVGILSDSYDRLGGAAAGVASGDLPAGVVVLTEGPASSDEGRAMAEIVHDLAPGAGIAFASAFFGQAAFADSIRQLASPSGAGCSIITDDIFYFDEPMFQDGPITQAIDEVVDQRGVTYFALAGNLARQSYEADGYRPASDAALGAGTFHDFDPGPGEDTRQRITIPPGAQVILTLQWDDPFYTTGSVDSDVDIYLVPAGSDTPINGSASDNLATQVPSERFSYTNTSGGTQFDVVIQLFAGPAPTKLKYVNYGANSSADIIFNEYGTNSATIIPHGAASRGRGVGAVNYFAQDGATDFSSAGPYTAIFAPNGVRLATPVVRQKPDFVAIQGADTTFFGSDADGNGRPNFFGTSAAAPHAAAIAALVRQADPSLTPDQVYARIEASARDLGPAGRDDLNGLGLINAYDAVFGSRRRPPRRCRSARAWRAARSA